MDQRAADAASERRQVKRKRPELIPAALVSIAPTPGRNGAVQKERFNAYPYKS